MVAQRCRRSALSLLAALAVSACAVGGAMPPLAPSDGPGLGRVGLPSGIAGARGQQLALTVWEATGPARAAIVAVHGYGDHGESTFGRAAPAWAEAGIVTYAYDQDGFGRNPTRGRWRGAAGLAADLVAVVGEVRRRHPCLPLTVVGHSMGGGVALAAAPGMAADGVVLAAPAIWGGAALNPLHRASAWLAAMVVPERRFTGDGLVRIQPSDNIEMLIELGRDPLHLGQPSARELFGLVRVVDLAEAAAPDMELPSLLLLGAKDEIVPNGRVRTIYERLPGPRRTIVYEEGWHMLFRDLQAERVWADVAAWALARQAPPACDAGHG